MNHSVARPTLRIAVGLIWLLALPTVGLPAVPVPLIDAKPVDVARLRIDNPTVISTNGSWRFDITRGSMVAGKFVQQQATASSSQSPAGDALDNDPNTRWCADNADMPQWWQIDLGATESIVGVQLKWEFGDGHYRFRVEAGPDDTHLTTVADRTTGDGMSDGKLDWPAVSARVLRITVTSATDAGGESKWASIREATIAVMRDGKRVNWTPVANVAADAHADDFASTTFDDKSWHDLPVPSNWEVLGYSHPTYGHADSTVGLYRRFIDIPATFTGKRVMWHFDGVTDSAEIWVNGQRVGYHEGGFTAFDIDLTPAIKPGERNLLAVRVCKSTPSVELDTGDYWLLGGIHRESYLVALPATQVDDITVVTKLDANYRDATLLAEVKIAGKPSENVKLTGRLFTADGKATDVPPIETSGTIGADGSTSLHLERAVSSPKLWSAEKPSLYYLVLSLQRGEAVEEVVQQRFGFRQVEIKDGVVLWNGVPIKLCGTCRHEEWSAVGHALTEHEWQTDVAMMKAANINAIRTSHYNHAERFMELCDEKGFYVLDEIPACWVSNKDPKFKDAFIQHAAETLARDKNKPCVLAWSCGNESGWGPNFKAMADYVATTDPTRPRFVSEVQKSSDPVLSFNDHHYPQDASLRKMSEGGGPDVITEGPHIFYNIGHQAYDYGLNDLWGVALERQWNRIWPSKAIFGAFIWEWQDQGLADKYPGKDKVNADGLRSENSKGIVTGYRVAKPEYYHVKMVYSPVATEAREVQADDGQWRVPFVNRYAFTDLSELNCRWQAMGSAEGGEPIARGDVKLSCAPGATTIASFPVTPRAGALRVAFVDSACGEIYAVRLHVAGAPLPAPPATSLEGDTHLVALDAAGVVGVRGGGFSVSIDPTTGKVTLATGGKAQLIGPTLNLGELRHDDGDFLNKSDAPWIGSKSPPVLKNAHVVGAMIRDDQYRATVSADVTLIEKPDRALGRMTYILSVHPNGQIDWSYHLAWTATDMQAWELGLKFDLSGSGDTFTWYRNGQWTEYPAGHVGANFGSATHEDRSIDSTKRDTVWATVGGNIAVLASDTPLHTRCKFADGATTLFTSTAVSVDRDFSSGYVDDTRITFRQGRNYEGSFRLRLVGGHL